MQWSLRHSVSQQLPKNVLQMDFYTCSFSPILNQKSRHRCLRMPAPLRSFSLSCFVCRFFLLLPGGIGYHEPIMPQSLKHICILFHLEPSFLPFFCAVTVSLCQSSSAFACAGVFFFGCALTSSFLSLRRARTDLRSLPGASRCFSDLPESASAAS